MRTNKSIFEEVEMEQGDLLKRVIRRKATFVGHISRMNDDRLLKRVWEIRDGHREVKRGRSRTEVDAEVTKMFGCYLQFTKTALTLYSPVSTYKFSLLVPKHFLQYQARI